MREVSIKSYKFLTNFVHHCVINIINVKLKSNYKNYTNVFQLKIILIMENYTVYTSKNKLKINLFLRVLILSALAPSDDGERSNVSSE